MNIKQIVIAHLRSIGADGLCAEACGCGLDDIFACGLDRDITECKPAKRHACDGECSGCLSDGEHDRISDCYRPIKTTTKEINMQAAIVSVADVPAIIGMQFEGGFFAGLFRAGGKKFAIVTAPKAEGEKKCGQWNDSYSIVQGTLSFFDGMANTQAMAEAGSKLAKWALGLNIGGHNDWHIPAQDVLEIIYRNLKPTTDENWCYARSGINLSAIEPTRPYVPTFPLQTLADAFKQGGSEAFEQTVYWTSTQHVSASDCAWVQDFDDGNQSGNGKTNEFSARAVRILEIQ